MFKKIMFFAILTLCMAGMTSCGGAKSELQSYIREMNTELPEDIGDGLVVSSVTYNGDEVMVTVNVDEDYIAVSDIELYEDDFIEGMNGEMGDDDSQELLTLCQDAGARIVYRFVGSQGGHYDMSLEVIDVE